MNIKITLVAEIEGEKIFSGEYSRVQDLEEEGLRKLEKVIEGEQEKNQDLADQIRSDESKAEELKN